MSKVNMFAQGLGLKPLAADPTSPSDGQLYMSDGTVRGAGLWRYSSTSSAWVAVGAGGGGLDVFHTEDFESNKAADHTSGNAATVDAAGTGTLDGTLADEESAQFAGDRSLKYIMGSSSANDFFLQDADIAVELKQTSNDIGVSFYYTYNGDDDDVRFFVLDQDDVELSSSIEFIKAKSTPTRFTTSFYLPVSSTGLRYGFQVGTGNSAKVLIVDDFELSTNPFVYKNLLESQSDHYSDITGFGSTATKIPYFSTNSNTSGSGIYTITNDSTDGLVVTFLRDADVTSSLALYATSTGTQLGISLNASSVTTNVYNIADVERIASSQTASNNVNTTSTNIKVKRGDILRPHTSGVSNDANSGVFTILAQSATEHVVTPASATSEIVTYTGYTSKNGGGFVKFATEKDNTSSKLITAINVDHTKYTFNESCLFNTEVTYDGSASGSNLRLYNSAGTAIRRCDGYEAVGYWSCVLSGKANIGDYLTFEAGGTPNNNLTTSFSVTAQPIEATFLAAIPVQKVAYVSHNETSGTAGGASTANTVQVRDLNTISGPDSEIVSLSTKRFKLQTGKYTLDGMATGFEVNAHQLFFYNYTTSTYIEDGLSGQNIDSSVVATTVLVSTTLNVSGETEFELRHWTQTAQATNGLGVPSDIHASNPQTKELYAQVKITKLR